MDGGSTRHVLPELGAPPVISVLPVAKCLRVALGEAPPAGMPAEVADAAREYLAPLPARAPEIRWMIGHYGAMRGLDAMSACDGLVRG